MAKPKARYVRIDQGYGTNSDWYTVRVIRSEPTQTLFEGQKERLLVELPGGERIWVAHWEELPSTK